MNFFQVNKHRQKKGEQSKHDYLDILTIPPSDIDFVRNWIISEDSNREQQMRDHILKKIQADPSFDVVNWQEKIINTLALEERQHKAKGDLLSKVSKRYTSEQLHEARIAIEKTALEQLTSKPDDVMFVGNWFSSKDKNPQQLLDFVAQQIRDNPSSFNVISWQKEMIKTLAKVYTPERLDELHRDFNAVLPSVVKDISKPSDVIFIEKWMVSKADNRDQQLLEHLAKKIKEDPTFDALKWRQDVLKNVGKDFNSEQLADVQRAFDRVALPALINGLTDLNLEEQNKRFKNFHETMSQHYRQSLLQEKLRNKDTNPFTWREVMSRVRKDAYIQLESELKKKKDPAEKLQLLQAARQMPIFTEHTNTSVLLGAYGQTTTVGKIDAEIKKLTKAHPEIEMTPIDFSAAPAPLRKSGKR